MSIPTGLVIDSSALVGGIGGATVYASDSFTDVDGTLLTAHPPSGGGGVWARHPPASSNAIAPTIVAGRSVGENAASSSLYSVGSPPSANYVVSTDVVMRADNNLSMCGPAGRIVPGVVTYYHARYNTLSNAWQLYKWVAAAATQLGTDQLATLTVDQAYRCDLSMIGTTIAMIVNGVTLVNVSDPAISGPGLAGLKWSGAATSTTGLHLDNFSVVTR